MRLAVVVPGHGVSRGERGHRITKRCLRVVAEAERVAARLGAETVVLSGWAPGGGPSEAEQMRDAWRGPDVELVVEPTARITAENASRTLPLLLERGIERAVVVCALPHLPRTRFLFRGVYGAAGVETRFHALRLVPAPTAVVWELAALPLSPFQLRAARAELARAAR
jgi:uncharacterized SAM-binding protein YcdF (DUF218 family)